MTTGIVLFLLACPSFADEPPARLGSRDQSHRFLAEGKQGLVVGLTGRRAVHVGVEVLKNGGSAADAAAATALMQIVEAAGSYVSFAGILSMTYYEASTGKVHSLNACFNTPIEEKDPLSIPKLDVKNWKALASGRTALVPGFMAGVQAAHDRFGKLPLAELFKPAIQLAREGFPVEPSLANHLQFRKEVLSRLAETKRVFTKKNSEFYAAGDLFCQPDLAETLQQVATHGAEYMYTGEWGKRFVDAVRRDGGLITARDLEAYRAIWEEPVETTYRGSRVFAPGSSSLGGVNAIEALNILELAGLSRSGVPSRSAESLFRLMQITNGQMFSFAPELAAARFPDRDFSPKARVTKEHAQWAWSQIQKGMWPYGGALAGVTNRSNHSSGVVAVNQWGNVAALSHTIYTAVWGSTGIFVGGVSIPDTAAFEQEAIKRAGPGKRLPEHQCPVIITRDGKPILASTAIGGGIHQRNVQVLANILEFGMGAQAAVNSPAYVLPDWSENRAVARVGEGTFDKTVLDGVRALGQDVRVLPRSELDAFIGYWAGVQIDPKTGQLHGAGTSELPSFAAGY